MSAVRLPGPATLAVASLCLLCLVAVASRAGAADVDALRDRSDQAKGEVERLSQELQASRARYDQARSQADAAAAEQGRLESLLAEGEERSAELAAALERSREDLRRERRRLARATKALAQRLVSMYKAGVPDTTDLILGSADFSDVTSRVAYFDALRDADTALAARVRQVRDTIRENAERQARLSARVAAHNARLASARDRIASVRLAAESSAAQLAAINGSREAEIGQLKNSLDSLASRIQKAERESREEAEQQVAEYYGGPYSIPTYIVMCESGGDYQAVNPSSGAGGAYQIMPETWAAYGGEGLPQNASKEEQDRIAALIYADSGTSPWVCG